MATRKGKTRVESQSKPKPGFAKGDRVRVKAGTAHPAYGDLPIGGWAGTINEIYEPSRSHPSYYYGIRWSEQTLQHAHPVYGKRCQRDSRDYDESWMNEKDLEPDPGGPLNIEQPTQIITRPLSLKRQNDRIRMVFGLTTDDAIPWPDEATRRRYEEYLAREIAFPLEAWYVGGPLGSPRPVMVLRPLESDGSAGARGALFEVRDQQGTFCCPLLGVDVPKRSPGFQALNDYYCWLDGLLDCDSEAYAGYEGEVGDAEEEAYDEDESCRDEETEDDSWDDEDDWEEDEEEVFGEEPDEEEDVLDRMALGSIGLPELPREPLRRDKPRVGRNDPCPCGSGKKYKKCCLSKDREETAGQEAEEEPKLVEEMVRSRGPRFRMPKPRPKPTDTVYQLRITLDGTDPPIWRRFQVKDCTLDKLHKVLQVVMGWSDDHLYQFEAGKQRFSPGNDEFGELLGHPSQDATRTLLSELAKRKGSKFGYEYDFGDSWWHLIEVEERIMDQPDFQHPVCLEGQLACPPEDCGGVWGYYECLEALKHRDDPDYADRLDWLGEYDPDDFDPHRVNRVLARWWRR